MRLVSLLTAEHDGNAPLSIELDFLKARDRDVRPFRINLRQFFPFGNSNDPQTGWHFGRQGATCRGRDDVALQADIFNHWPSAPIPI
jgi:hypothetical protein